MNSQKKLEEEADRLLADDIAENGFDGKILLDEHLKRRRKKEVYSQSGVLDDGFKPGMYQRASSPFKSADERRKKTDEQ